MSKEREMIEKLCSFQMTYSDWLLLIADAEELLAQPEQPSIPRHALDSYWGSESYQRGYAVARKDYKQKVINAFGADDENI